jgi:isoquinoline 1-oxidoreductase subunit alpha
MATNCTVNGKAALLCVIRETSSLPVPSLAAAPACAAPALSTSIARARTQVSEVAGKSVTTIEGLSPDSHPVQQPWLAEQVPQCGYCQSGQIMSAADLLKHNPKPTRVEIIEHMSANICRCGTYQRIVRAVEERKAVLRGGRDHVIRGLLRRFCCHEAHEGMRFA